MTPAAPPQLYFNICITYTTQLFRITSMLIQETLSNPGQYNIGAPAFLSHTYGAPGGRPWANWDAKDGFKSGNSWDPDARFAITG